MFTYSQLNNKKTNNTCCCPTASGSSGTPTGAPTGATGTTTGTPGATGATGTPGTPGVTGATGTPGTPGVTGATGTPGTPGVTGATGTPGTPGVTGGVNSIVNLNTHFFRDNVHSSQQSWQLFYAYATTQPGSLLANVLGSGSCPPQNQYTIYNYYCNSLNFQLTLTNLENCKDVLRGSQTHAVCHSVEAFIDTGTLIPPYPPVFYRCYFTYIPVTDADIIDFEWSASSEYIEWYVTNISSKPNDMYHLILNQGGTPPIPTGHLVPLLKVTNHSPRLF